MGAILAIAATAGCARSARQTAPLIVPACPSIEVPARLAAPNVIILLGELHGTDQAPRFIGDLACTLTRRGIPITVGLELPIELSDRLQRMLTADRRNETDWQTVLTGTWQDGRRSTAIATLIERLGDMRRAGANVELVSYAPDSAPTSQARDEGMSRALAALAAHHRTLLVLSGNLHNRLRAGTAVSPIYRPAGFELARLIDATRIVSLDMGYEAGTSWLCSGPTAAECGLRHLGGRHPMPWGAITLFDSLDAEGYNGRYGVGPITAALPAIGR
jgi:hypothetical protein